MRLVLPQPEKTNDVPEMSPRRVKGRSQHSRQNFGDQNEPESPKERISLQIIGNFSVGDNAPESPKEQPPQLVETSPEIDNARERKEKLVTNMQMASP